MTNIRKRPSGWPALTLVAFMSSGCDDADESAKAAPSRSDNGGAPSKPADAGRPQPETPTAPLAGGELAEAVAQTFAEACPPGALDDADARNRCADALTQDETLETSFKQPYVLWGGQSPDAGYEIAKSNTTRLDPRVLKRLYLSTFGFEADHHIEQDGERYIAHVPVVFRNALDAGEYPYPFWHSQPKWQSYERTEEILFFVEDASVVAVLRSSVQDPERAHVEREWDGRWQWDSERGAEPRVALYGFLFSEDNPHVFELESTFREFSDKEREAACTTCHNPGNPSKINPLEFFNFPNQALTGRHDIVAQLEGNLMPPPTGIDEDSYRQELLALAKRFADLGDRALEFEAAD